MGSAEPVFQDTTILVDRTIRVHDPDRTRAIAELLGQFGYKLACVFSRHEYKKVVLRNWALLLSYLIEHDGSFFAVLDRVSRLQRRRQQSTLIHMLGWLGRSVDQAIEVRRGEGVDRQLGLQAESFLRNALRYGWKRLEHLSDSTADKLNCQRGKEPPVLGGDGSVDAHVPEGKCADKRCNVANFFLSNLPLIRKVAGQIRQLREEDRRENREERERRATDELLTIADQFDATERNPARLYNCNACLKFADLWIHLECLAAGAKDLATTNYRESQVLCPGLGIQMHLPQDSSSADGELGAEGG